MGLMAFVKECYQCQRTMYYTENTASFFNHVRTQRFKPRLCKVSMRFSCTRHNKYEEINAPRCRLANEFFRLAVVVGD